MTVSDCLASHLLPERYFGLTCEADHSCPSLVLQNLHCRRHCASHDALMRPVLHSREENGLNIAVFFFFRLRVVPAPIGRVEGFVLVIESPGAEFHHRCHHNFRRQAVDIEVVEVSWNLVGSSSPVHL